MIRSLQLENWKTHSSLSLDFKPGVNILLGPIGSGKSSILQAISFALFGTFAELKSRDVKLNNLITRGPHSNAGVILNLSDLIITRKINKATEAVIRDKEDMLLAGPAPTEVNNYVSQILKISEDVFLRNIYAMQNEIDLLLKLNPKERKKRADELMGFDKFEDARANCITLKNKILNEIEVIKKIQEEVDILKLNEQVNLLETQCKELKAREAVQLTNLRNILREKEQTREALENLRKQAQEVSELESRSKFLLNQIEKLKTRLSGRELTLTKEQIEDKLNTIKNIITESQNNKSTLILDIETSQKASLGFERDVGKFEEKSREIQDKLNELRKVREQLTEVDLTEVQEVEKNIQEKTEQKQTLLAELKTLRKGLDNLTLAESTCPVCDSALTEEKKAKLLSQKKQEIASKLLTQNEITEKLKDLKKRFTELEKLKDLQKRFSEKLAEENKLIEEQKISSEKLTNSQKDKSKLEEMIKDKSLNLKKLEEEIEKLNSEHTSLMIDKSAYDYKEQKEEYEKELSEIYIQLTDRKIDSKVLENAELRFQDMIKQEQAVQSEIKSDKSLLAEKNIRLEDLKIKLKEVQEVEKKVKKSEKNIELLNRFAAALQATQIALRDELILAVNEMMTTLWIDLYPYDKWSGVRLFTEEDDYILQLKEADGDWIPVVGFASGGERMLASLAVRIAFARILSPNFSLLILDEPTQNLDDKAIDSLIEVIQDKLSNYLEQIFIVTHNERLAEVGDNVIRL